MWFLFLSLCPVSDTMDQDSRKCYWPLPGLQRIQRDTAHNPHPEAPGRPLLLQGWERPRHSCHQIHPSGCLLWVNKLIRLSAKKTHTWHTLLQVNDSMVLAFADCACISLLAFEAHTQPWFSTSLKSSGYESWIISWKGTLVSRSLCCSTFWVHCCFYAVTSIV